MKALLAGKRVLVLGMGEVADVVAAALDGVGATCGQAHAWDETAPSADLDAVVHVGVAKAAAPATALDLAGWRAAQSDDLDDRFFAAAGFARRCFAGKRGGSILMLSPAHGGAARASVNGALDNLVKSLGAEWARDGVRTNAVITRRIKADGTVDPGARRALGALSAWLLSDYSSYVNGCVMGVDETETA